MPGKRKASHTKVAGAKKTKTQHEKGLEMFSLPRKSALRLISWNVNGLRAIMKRENDPLRSLVNKHQPDILCLSETKCQADTLRSKEGKSLGLDVLLEAEGYESYWAFSRDRKGYSGVAVFVRPSSERGTADVKLTYGLTGAAAKRLGAQDSALHPAAPRFGEAAGFQ